MIEQSFYFLRHGQTDWNVAGITQGQTDTQLNAKGRQQAVDACIILKNISVDRVVASPLLRAAETAEIVNDVLQKPLNFAEGLKERHFGVYQGKTLEEIVQWEKDNNWQTDTTHSETRFVAPPDSEHYDDFSIRVVQTVKNYTNLYPNESILFVAHGGAYKALSFNLLKEYVPTKNAHPYHFENNNGQWQLNCLVTAHQAKLA